MRLSDKFDLIRSLHGEGLPACPSERLPVQAVGPDEITATGHKTSQKPSFPYLFEEHSGVHSPWMPAEGASGGYGFIGSHSYVNGGGYLRDRVLIGRYCSVGRRVTIAAGMHRMDGLSTSPALSAGRPRAPDESSPDPGARPAFTIIESDVWIGDGAVIMPGVRLGLGSVVGANAVVTRDTTPYGIYAGAPATLLRRRFPDETCAALMGTAWWDLPHRTLAAMPLDRIDDCLPLIERARVNEAADLATYAALGA